MEPLDLFLNVFTEFSKRVRTYHLLCKRPGWYDTASKTHVTDGIFKLTPIHASVIYLILWIRWNHRIQSNWSSSSFRKNSIDTSVLDYWWRLPSKKIFITLVTEWILEIASKLETEWWMERWETWKHNHLRNGLSSLKYTSLVRIDSCNEF